MEEKWKVVEIRKKEKDWANLTVLCKRSKLNQEGNVATVVWKLGNEWLTQKVILDQKRKMLDAEMMEISEVVKIAWESCLTV